MVVQILGAGAWGLAAALALSGRGHAVHVHDPRGIGSGASAKAAGIVTRLLWDDRDARLAQRTVELLQETEQLRSAWRTASSVVVGSAGSKPMADLAARARRLGLAVQVDEPDGILEGVQFHPGEWALWVEGDGVVEVGDLCSHLADACRTQGVTFGKVHPSPEATVIAAGPWTPGILAERGRPLPLIPYRVQLASLRIPGGENLPIVHDLVQHFYARPGGHGEALAGNGTQARRFDPNHYNEAGDPDFVESIATRVVHRFPLGRQARIAAAWAGLVVATPDRRPLIGRIPNTDNAYVMSGDNGFGIMRSLALGEALADAVDGKTWPDLDPSRFGPEAPLEFQVREGFEPQVGR